jgi:hypothetical protein
VTDGTRCQICHKLRSAANWVQIGLILSNGYWRQIRETRELLARIWRGQSHFSLKWPLANVGESGEYSVNGCANVGESGESRKLLKIGILASTRIH